MNRNKLLLFAMIFVVLTVIVLLLKATTDDLEPGAQNAVPVPGDSRQTISDAERDTYVNTISTMNQRNLDLEKRIVEIERLNEEKLSDDEMVEALVARKVDEKSKATFDEFKQNFNDLLSSSLPNLGSESSNKGYSIPPESTSTATVSTNDAEGLGFDSLLSPGKKILGGSKPLSATELQSVSTQDNQAMVLISPFTRVAYTDDKENPVPVSITGEPIRPEKEGSRKIAKDEGETIPFYTIPRNATLFENTTLTALLGIVPNVQGSIIDPIRFKIITGAENLATNGHSIPGVENIVWSGIAVGNREMSCIRGEVHSVTFTFEDGRVYTQSSTRDGSTTTTNIRQMLGYISDTRGVPCLKGQLITNAQDYLNDRIIASGVGATAQAYSETQETTVITEGGSTQTFFTGDEGKYIAGQTLSGSLSELNEYLRERARNAVDLVYLEGGQDVVLHVEVEITIDYITNGRKLDHANTIPGKYSLNNRASFD